MIHIPRYPDTGDHAPNMLSEQPTIHPSARIYDAHIGAYTEIGANTLLIESTFGDYSYTAGDADIIYADVGKFTSIASHVRINPGNHPMERVTQHHLTYRRTLFGFAETDDAAFFEWRRAHRCTVGHDVWIGHAAIIMPGVSIGTGAVVGSGAVVTKDVAPYQIVGGVPAKLIRARFSDEIAAALLEIAWWDWDHATLKARFDDLLSVPSFIAKYR
ncbi:MAG: DapH/DapD/GlmU-related protein [Chloroflexota bacterium]|nr:DapH/DapD/GlmU-related protein [Chloroflexota bacterium]